MLAALDTAQTIDDMDIPGYRLHPLKGKLKGRWSVSVSGNWRLTFEFPFDVSVRSLAESLDVSPSTLTRVINGVSGVSPGMALRLSKALGRSPESWLAMQHNYDLWQAKESTDLTQVRKASKQVEVLRLLPLGHGEVIALPLGATNGAQIVDELSTKYVSVQSGLLKQPYGRE